MQSFDTEFIHIQQCSLPSRSKKLNAKNDTPFKMDGFPASCSLFSEPKEKSNSGFVYYDGSKKSFTEPISDKKDSKKRKRAEKKSSLIPRPANCFINARGLLQQKIKEFGASTVECSNIMSFVWKLNSVNALKHYFRYIAFVEGARHNALYPNYRYQPTKKPRSKSPQDRKPYDGMIIPEYTFLKSPSSSESEEGYATSDDGFVSKYSNPPSSGSSSFEYQRDNLLPDYTENDSQSLEISEANSPDFSLMELTETEKSYREAMREMEHQDVDYTIISSSFEFLISDILNDTVHRSLSSQNTAPNTLDIHSYQENDNRHLDSSIGQFFSSSYHMRLLPTN